MQGTTSYAKLPGAAVPHIGCKEYLMTVASRLYFSSFYRVVYCSMIASSLVCVVWVRPCPCATQLSVYEESQGGLLMLCANWV